MGLDVFIHWEEWDYIIVVGDAIRIFYDGIKFFYKFGIPYWRRTECDTGYVL
jgi:hypothetical protein